jgi:hypothetical protein
MILIFGSITAGLFIMSCMKDYDIINSSLIVLFLYSQAVKLPPIQYHNWSLAVIYYSVMADHQSVRITFIIIPTYISFITMFSSWGPSRGPASWYIYIILVYRMLISHSMSWSVHHSGILCRTDINNVYISTSRAAGLVIMISIYIIYQKIRHQWWISNDIISLIII